MLELDDSGLLKSGTGDVAFSPDGRLVAAFDGGFDPRSGATHVWDIQTGRKTTKLKIDGEEDRGGTGFTEDGRLLTGTSSGVVAWDLETGGRELIAEANLLSFAASLSGNRILLIEKSGGNRFAGL